MMSTSERLALASFSTRCMTLSESARQTFTFTPYLRSKAPTRSAMSSGGIEE